VVWRQTTCADPFWPLADPFWPLAAAALTGGITRLPGDALVALPALGRFDVAEIRDADFFLRQVTGMPIDGRKLILLPIDFHYTTLILWVSLGNTICHSVPDVG
jgi:hypothetical protein